MSTPQVGKTPAQTLMETELIARLYESFLWRRNPLLILLLGSTFNREYRIVSRSLALRGDEIVLDLACGPGIFTRRFAREASHGDVLGMDLSGPMLKHAGRLAKRERIQNLHLIRGDALCLPFARARFNVVNCAAALHLFRDLDAAFTEVNRVLQPAGTFTFSTFRYPQNQRMRQFLHLREYIVGIRSFRQEDIESGLRKAGFSEIRYLHARGIWVVMSATKIQ